MEFSILERSNATVTVECDHCGISITINQTAEELENTAIMQCAAKEHNIYDRGQCNHTMCRVNDGQTSFSHECWITNKARKWFIPSKDKWSEGKPEMINYQALSTMKADPEEIFLVTCLNNKKNKNIETYKKTLPQLID